MSLQHRYIEAMGITLYAPRYILPGAAASVRQKVVRVALPAAVPAGIDESDVPAPLRADDAVSSPASARAPMPVFDFKDTRPTANNAPVADTEAVESAPRFSAALVDAGIGLLMMTSGTPSALSDDSKRLMANIARAAAQHFGLQAQLRFTPSEFVWPFVNQNALKMTANSARDALAGKLLAQAEQCGVRVLLVFGDALLPYINESALSGAGVQCVQAAALDVLMADPTTKAALWQQLQSASLSSQI